MKKVLLFFMFFFCLSSAAAEEHPVTLKIISDYTTDSEECRLGVLFEIKDGWYIYWKEPGETGLPTKIDIKLKNGSASALHYPIPKTFKQAGIFTSYGYEKRVLLWFDLKGVSKNSEVSLLVDWLACGTDLCIPGKQLLKTELSPTLSETSSKDLFNLWEKKLPKDPLRYHP
ncbi:MAG: protein-disulfide reductase DsbD domain-containing protein [Bdellovibrionota bacterium]|jgi:DsbC/DsbD-like thiol-disulfide interchange protein